jgi:hypothetical protein
VTGTLSPPSKPSARKSYPPKNPESDAIDAANRIGEAIVKFGYNNELAAKDFIGELGWLIVQRQGGWEAICQNTMAHQMPTLKAQWRELGKSLYDRAKRGTLGEAPKLPEGPKAKILQLSSSVKTLNRKDWE